MTELPPPAPVDSLALARRLATLAAERRATDLLLLDVRELVDYTDFFLLATGQSARQNQAIGEHLVKTMKGEHRYALSKSGLDTGSWICIDLGDVVVHVFEPEMRARYDLELLWADAPRPDVAEETPAVAAVEVPVAAAAPAAEPAPATPRRRRVTRKAAVEDADAANAPEGTRPPLDEPEPEVKKPLPRTRREVWGLTPPAASTPAAAPAAADPEAEPEAPAALPPTPRAPAARRERAAAPAPKSPAPRASAPARRPATAKPAPKGKPVPGKATTKGKAKPGAARKPAAPKAKPAPKSSASKPRTSPPRRKT